MAKKARAENLGNPHVLLQHGYITSVVAAAAATK